MKIIKNIVFLLCLCSFSNSFAHETEKKEPKTEETQTEQTETTEDKKNFVSISSDGSSYGSGGD